jgi:predicted negative regulator of RcsB-dependent stress response
MAEDDVNLLGFMISRHNLLIGGDCVILLLLVAMVFFGYQKAQREERKRLRSSSAAPQPVAAKVERTELPAPIAAEEAAQASIPKPTPAKRAATTPKAKLADRKSP